MYSANLPSLFFDNDLTPQIIRLNVGVRFGNPANCCQDLGICQINDAPYSEVFLKNSTNKGNAILTLQGESCQIQILKKDLNPTTVAKHLSRNFFAIYMPYRYKGVNIKKLGAKEIIFKQGIYPLADQEDRYSFSPDMEVLYIRTPEANAQFKHSSTFITEHTFKL